MIAIILPAYNESEALPLVLTDIDSALRNQPYKAVVIDDGSTDDTLAVLKNLSGRYPVEIVRHEKNLGLGAAIKSGLEYFLKNFGQSDVMITMDADNTCPASMIENMLRELESGSDVVSASRWAGQACEEGVPWHRRMLSRYANTILRFFFPINGFSDYTSGCRAFSGEILRRLRQEFGGDCISRTGFSGGIELLVKLRSIKAKFSQTPFILRYDRKRGKSKMRIVRYIFEIMGIILHYRCKKL